VGGQPGQAQGVPSPRLAKAIALRARNIWDARHLGVLPLQGKVSRHGVEKIAIQMAGLDLSRP
jgi:hypothetical protein